VANPGKDGDGFHGGIREDMVFGSGQFHVVTDVAGHLPLCLGVPLCSA